MRAYTCIVMTFTWHSKVDIFWCNEILFFFHLYLGWKVQRSNLIGIQYIWSPSHSKALSVVLYSVMILYDLIRILYVWGQDHTESLPCHICLVHLDFHLSPVMLFIVGIILLTVSHYNIFRWFFFILVGYKSSEIFQKIWNSIHSCQTGAGVLAYGS